MDRSARARALSTRRDLKLRNSKVAEDMITYLRSRPRIGLVGASRRPEKFGNIILRTMSARGYSMIPINGGETEIDGLVCYPNLQAAHAARDLGLVVYVVPPPRTLRSLAEAKQLGLMRVWIQPGAGDSEVRKYLRENSFSYRFDACVMVDG